MIKILFTLIFWSLSLPTLCEEYDLQTLLRKLDKIIALSNKISYKQKISVEKSLKRFDEAVNDTLKY